MMTTNDMIKFGEELMQDKETPASTQAALYRTLLELRGFIGAKATKSLAGEEMDGTERTAAQIRQEIAALENQQH